MNEEIKEIKEILEYISLSSGNKEAIKGANEVLKCITDLQEENQKLNKIIDGIENYLKVGIAMNFNINNNKFSEQTVDNYNDILDKLLELKNEVE